MKTAIFESVRFADLLRHYNSSQTYLNFSSYFSSWITSHIPEGFWQNTYS